MTANPAQHMVEEKGPRCPKCGSKNTTRDAVLRSSPSVLAVIFFGWIFLLIRGALAMRRSICLDCNTPNKYKSIGSWFALCILVLLAALVALAVFGEL